MTTDEDWEKIRESVTMAFRDKKSEQTTRWEYFFSRWTHCPTTGCQLVPLRCVDIAARQQHLRGSKSEAPIAETYLCDNAVVRKSNLSVLVPKFCPIRPVKRILIISCELFGLMRWKWKSSSRQPRRCERIVNPLIDKFCLRHRLLLLPHHEGASRISALHPSNLQSPLP